MDVTPGPAPADTYEPRTAAAVRSVLLEIGQALGSYRGKFAVIGGTVPWLLLDNDEMHHIGSIDVDLSLDPEALADGEYATVVELLLAQGYAQRQNLKKFQLVRTVLADDGGPDIAIIVDFLMPRDAQVEKNDPPLVDNFAVQKADGAALALRYFEEFTLSGTMPLGGTNTVTLRVASVPALLAMKGFAISGRAKDKDGYDIYYCIRNYPTGFKGLAEDCAPLLAEPEAVAGFNHIASRFENIESHGPHCVRRFVVKENLLDGRDADQWQVDAFGQVDAWLKALGRRV